MVKFTDVNENSMGTKIVVADLKWGHATEASQAKKPQKVCCSPLLHDVDVLNKSHLLPSPCFFLLLLF